MKIQFLNIYVDNLTMEEAVDEIDQMIATDRKGYIVTPNMDGIVILEEDEMFQKAYDEAALVLTDGKPLIWISHLLRAPIKEKVSGSDLFPELCGRAAEKGYTIFILGAEEGVAPKAIANMKKKYPDIRFCGYYSPPYGFEKKTDELKKTIDRINEAKPDILAVALGAPKGEKFLYQVRDRINAKISLQIGATIDFMAGKVKRAPKWMSDMGFEWLFRIMQEPKRLLKRYVRDAVKIIPIIIKYAKQTKEAYKKERKI